MKIKNLEDVFRYLPIKGETAFSNAKGKFQEKIKKQQLKYLRDHVAELQHSSNCGASIEVNVRDSNSRRGSDAYSLEPSAIDSGRQAPSGQILSTQSDDGIDYDWSSVDDDDDHFHDSYWPDPVNHIYSFVRQRPPVDEWVASRHGDSGEDVDDVILPTAETTAKSDGCYDDHSYDYSRPAVRVLMLFHGASFNS